MIDLKKQGNKQYLQQQIFFFTHYPCSGLEREKYWVETVKERGPRLRIVREEAEDFAEEKGESAMEAQSYLCEAITGIRQLS